MAVVIIDGHHIDLEMITDLEVDYIPKCFCATLTIYIVGRRNPLEIRREIPPNICPYGTVDVARLNRLDALTRQHVDYKFFRGIVSKRALHNVRTLRANRAIRLMYEALMQRWQPSMVKFDDITVK